MENKKIKFLVIPAIMAVIIASGLTAIPESGNGNENGGFENFENITTHTYEPFNPATVENEEEILNQIIGTEEMEFLNSLGDVEALIYGHAYSVGIFDPTTTEWIVILSSDNENESRVGVFRLDFETLEIKDTYTRSFTESAELSVDEAIVLMENKLGDRPHAIDEVIENDVERIGTNYVLTYPAHDFGGTIIVNENAGEVVFYGTTVWNGTGGVIAPERAELEPIPIPPENLPDPSNYGVTGLEVNPTEAEVWEQIEVTVDVVNEDNYEGPMEVELKIDEEIRKTNRISLKPGEEGTVTFQISKSEADNYLVQAGDFEKELEVKRTGPEPITQQGSDNFISEPFELVEGLAILNLEYEGEVNFTAYLVGEEAEEKLAVLDISAGSYNGSRVLIVSEGEKISPGEYRLEVETSGNWNVEIEIPHIKDAPEAPKQIVGDGDFVSDPFVFDGDNLDLTLRHDSDTETMVSLYSLDGKLIDSIYLEGNTPGSEEVFEINDDFDIESNIYYLEVNSTGLWGIRL